ncbi:Guanine nucleotide-binding protein-like 3 homolog OS=Caenorhabditis elegans GN=nst-1 PE=3 SV=1 [Rhizoctonia solani AG-1 IB]|uniref:Guanine nucleotide-binding protein-like 3 homolog n=1 Tax=Thanatephorus cucumeris (strain AG1-IB / isolate 7/3/14) TaxID=1108050 RepID=A0A0B7F859_THACB|nr:Guanine nucleotide-binding protein-like 3 homolog OS=Caenorhabditis elegans GN=nst-1 PE=3 SV=1 [Rhizoctonia solani AG-1 IB]
MEAQGQSAAFEHREDVERNIEDTTHDPSLKAYMREFHRVVEMSDVIIQVLDARDPMGCRSPSVEDEVRRSEKKLVGVLNKIDLVPKENVEGWLRYLRHDFPVLPFKSSTQLQRSNLSHSSYSASSSSGAQPLVQLLKSYASGAPPGTSIRIGVVGLPNVGKSSLINSLKRARACSVASTPGHTKVLQEIALDRGLKLLDSPGVVWEDVQTDSAQRSLRNVLRVEAVNDPVSAVESIISRVSWDSLQRLYTIPAFQNVTEFLAMIAMSRGRLTKGGAADLKAAGKSILHDWNTGRIPYHSTPPAVHPSSRPSVVAEGNQITGAEDVGEAKIVSQFGEAFDLNALFRDADAAVLGGDTDMIEENQEDNQMEEDSNLMQSDDLAPSIPMKRKSGIDTSLAAYPFSSLPSIDTDPPSPKRTRVGDSEGDLDMNLVTSTSQSPAHISPMSRKELRKSGHIGTGAERRRRKAERMAID